MSEANRVVAACAREWGDEVLEIGSLLEVLLAFPSSLWFDERWFSTHDHGAIFAVLFSKSFSFECLTRLSVSVSLSLRCSKFARLPGSCVCDSFRWKELSALTAPPRCLDCGG